MTAREDFKYAVAIHYVFTIGKVHRDCVRLFGPESNVNQPASHLPQGAEGRWFIDFRASKIDTVVVRFRDEVDVVECKLALG